MKARIVETPRGVSQMVGLVLTAETTDEEKVLAAVHEVVQNEISPHKSFSKQEVGVLYWKEAVIITGKLILCFPNKREE